ncbi:MAG: dihydroneopterin aldolase [Candidatus Promineifilaceae bacterium]
MDKTVIRDLLCQGILGIYPHERLEKQPILVNVVMFADVSKAAQTKQIEDAINYAASAELVRERVENGDDLLVETLVVDLARLLLEAMPIERVRVRVEKLAAVKGAAGVGVEIERSSADF